MEPKSARCAWRRAQGREEQDKRIWSAAAEVEEDGQCLFALAFLCTKLGRKTEAIAAWQRILRALAEDYAIRSGESVDWAKREIDKLGR